MNLLKKKIASFETKIFGLDLSDLSVKVFQLERENNFDKMRAFYSIDIPSGNIDDGLIINQEKVAEILKEAIKKAGPQKINTNKVICSLPESKVFLRIINIPKMSQKEAKEAVKWEMEVNIPLPIEDVYFDWQFIEGEKEEETFTKKLDGSSRQPILTVAIPKNVVDGIMEVLEKAGLEVYGLEVESIASARSLMDEKNIDFKSASLIVDFGAQRSSFIIMEGDIPFFTVSVPFSSEWINEAITQNMKVDRKEAEKIKVNNGIAGWEEDNAIFSSVKPLLENLVNEIEKTIDFYSGMKKPSMEVKQIILCGGGSNLKGLVEYLNKRLKREIMIGNPWVNLKLEKNKKFLSQEDSVRYSTVIGLALGGINYEN